MLAETGKEAAGGLGIEAVEIILLIGAVVAIIARRFKVPYTVGLVIAGIILAFLPLGLEVNFSKELIFKVLLPPLIFEAALYIHWKELKRDLLPVVTFASVGVLLSAGITATIMHFVIGWDWTMSALFGVLIAATDPVSVIATFKEAKVEGRLRLLVEAESLFNDSTAAVAFAIALTFAMGQSMSAGTAALAMLLSVVGGIASGLIVGSVCLWIAGRTTDHLVELALTTVAAFGSFWVAEQFGFAGVHFSGVLAAMTAGILVGNTNELGFITEKGDEVIEDFKQARGDEGANLQEMIATRLDAILEQVAIVESHLPEIAKWQREKLNQKLEELKTDIDESRLEQELIYLAQKQDVAEELDRLKSHVKETKKILTKGGACGRRLDFMMQEFNREANTLASKSINTDITNAAVELKVLIEQMREQIQNIE